MNSLETHPVPADVDPDSWQLRIFGAVNTPMSIDRDELRSFPMQSYTDVFECIEGWETDPLAWQGIRVETLLERSNPHPDAAYALVHGMDGEYACAFDLEVLGNAVLAVDLDGRPVPIEHGGPARLVPTDDDSVCWQQVKWVAGIEVTTTASIDRDTAKEIALGRIDVAEE